MTQEEALVLLRKCFDMLCQLPDESSQLEEEKYWDLTCEILAGDASGAVARLIRRLSP